MSRESTDKVLGLAALEQAEYRAAHTKLPAASSPAAGRNSEGAVRKGSQAASSGPTGAGAAPGAPDREAQADTSALGNDDRGGRRKQPLWPLSPSPLGSASTPTPASPTVPQGEAGPPTAVSIDITDMEFSTTAPRWSPVDSDTGDLLDLLAETHPATPSEAAEWPYFLDVLKKVADENDGLIDQNLTRPLLHGQIASPRVGAFFHRASRRGLIRPDGHTTTTNSTSGNGGKPARSYRWLGATA